MDMLQSNSFSTSSHTVKQAKKTILQDAKSEEKYVKNILKDLSHTEKVEHKAEKVRHILSTYDKIEGKFIKYSCRKQAKRRRRLNLPRNKNNWPLKMYTGQKTDAMLSSLI